MYLIWRQGLSRTWASKQISLDGFDGKTYNYPVVKFIKLTPQEANLPLEELTRKYPLEENDAD